MAAGAGASGARRLAAAVRRRAGTAWRRIRSWRRISFTTGGLAFTFGTFAIGLAAMNTGNNLLYLLLGAMLGFIAVSGWLSERAIRGLAVRRTYPHAVTVGHDFRVTYEVRNHKRRLPSLAVEVSDAGLPEHAFVAHVPPGGSTAARSLNSFVRRGIYPLSMVTLSTGFPFGMFRKERDLEISGTVVVWPRTDRPVREPGSGGGRMPHDGAVPVVGAAGARGEYRNLREYRPGDDPRDIHWRSAARLRVPVVREYERDGAETAWICLDTRGEPGDPAEVAVELAASLAARTSAAGRPFGLVAGRMLVPVGEGARQLERVLDALARVDFAPDEPAPRPPVDPAACVLVSIDGRPGWGEQLRVGRDARLGTEAAA